MYIYPIAKTVPDKSALHVLWSISTFDRCYDSIQKALNISHKLYRHVYYTFYYELDEESLIKLLLVSNITVDKVKDQTRGIITGSVSDWYTIAIRYMIRNESRLLRALLNQLIIYLETEGYTFEHSKIEIGDGTFIW